MSLSLIITLVDPAPGTGPFDIYSIDSLGNVTGPLATNIPKASLLSGYTLYNVPDNAVKILVESNNEYCQTSIEIIIPTTTTTSTTTSTTTTSTTTTTTTTTTTSTTTTTTCPPEEFFMELNGITSVSDIDITSTEPFSIFWDSTDPGSRVDYAAGTYTNISKTFSPAFTGTAKIQSCDLGGITTFVIPTVAPSATNTIVIEQSELVKLIGLLQFKVYNNVFVSGITTSNLNPTLVNIVIWSSDISGDIANLPSPLQEFDVRRTTASAPGLTGSIDTLYTLSPNLNLFWITAANDIDGNISSIPATAIRFAIEGSNQISGNFSSLSDNSALQIFVCNGANTITGNINNANWTNIRWMEVGGSGIKTGNINTISYNPAITQISFPSATSGITSGITGNLSFLPDTIFFLNLSDCTISGNATDIPTSCTTFILGNNGTLTGTVTGLPTVLQQIFLSGNNHTITGAINDLPANLRFVKIEGDGHNVSGYTGTRDWGTLNLVSPGQRTMCKFSILGAAMTSLSSTQADDLIIDLEATSSWQDSTSFPTPGDTKAVNYKGAAVASPAGIAAKAALEGPPRNVPVTNY